MSLRSPGIVVRGHYTTSVRTSQQKCCNTSGGGRGIDRFFFVHEVVNEMLGKKSGLSYEDVRDRYEHFRSRCRVSQKQRDVHEEKGCTEPVYGEKSKCVLQIVPQTTKCDTFQIDEKCKNKLV